MGIVRPLDEADPRTVGPYRLTGRLVVPAAGTAFLAEGPDLRPVVVTVVQVPADEITALEVAAADATAVTASDGEFRSRFADRTDAARHVASFAAEKVLDVDVTASRPYVVTEYVDGATVADTVRQNGPLAVVELARLAGGAANALAAVHAAGIAHENLRPDNVVLSTAGATRLVDVAGPRRPSGVGVPAEQ
nr:hypothetical protein [Micromonospora sp. DSM 115978]